jgi:hypothetical protein
MIKSSKAKNEEEKKFKKMPSVGFEPTRTSALVPKTRMSTSSITKALEQNFLNYCFYLFFRFLVKEKIFCSSFFIEKFIEQKNFSCLNFVKIIVNLFYHNFIILSI